MRKSAIGIQTPTHGTKHDTSYSYGQSAVDIAALAGQAMDPWQSDSLHEACSMRPDGRWLTRDVGLVVPRQNGKGGVLEALALLHLYVLTETRLILWTAHEFKTAKDAFRRMVGLIESTAALRKITKIRYQGGEETISVTRKDPSTGKEFVVHLRFLARSGASGRGFSADLVILDEAYDLTDDQLAAILPTVLARPNPQVWYTSSAPLLKSTVLRRICKRGRSGDPTITYAEWCAQAHDELGSHDAWARANPALGIRLDESALAAMYGSMDPEDFQREILGVWLEDEFESVISLTEWQALEIELPEDEELSSTCALAVDVSPDRSKSSIAAASILPDGTWLVEIIQNQSGTKWIVPRLVELIESHKPVAIVLDGGSPAASLIPDLEAEGIKVTTEPIRGEDEILYKVSGPELAQACGALYDAVTDAFSIRHLGDSALEKALENAAQRPLGDSWAWSRKQSSSDISPLVAITLARFGLALFGAEEDLEPIVIFG